MFKCPGWKFVGKVWNFCVLLLDDVTSWWMFKWRSGALARAQTIRYHFCYKHSKFGKFQYGLKGTERNSFTWNFYSNLRLINLTNLQNFNEIYFLEAAEISVRKSGFLQITEKTYTYSVRWQACLSDLRFRWNFKTSGFSPNMRIDIPNSHI